jgi:hypothetical protein
MKVAAMVADWVALKAVEKVATKADYLEQQKAVCWVGQKEQQLVGCSVAS